MESLSLAAGDYRLALIPARGGAIARFDWRGEPLMRPGCGPSILDTACFPLVPFSNRIAFGRFTADGQAVQLTPNMPGADHPHTIHGFGWLSRWDVIAAGPTHATLRHLYAAGGGWPWPYVAEQAFRLDPDGLHHALRITNRSDRPMPAGLGFHPYFPRTDRTLYHGLHRGEWMTSADGLPIAHRDAPEPIDWWSGRPAATRIVDTVYSGRHGSLTLDWPERRLRLRMMPSDALGCTVVYTPAGADFLCVEPVSHATDAINRMPAGQGMTWLRPGETLGATLSYRASRLPAD